MHAELHKKIPVPLAEFEDTLTDAVLSALRWLPRRAILGELVERLFARQLNSSTLESAEFLFWPRLTDPRDRSPCEPDAVILLEGLIVVIEAKAGADFAGSVSTGSHQLLREWRSATERWPGREIVVLALTGDWTEPPAVRRVDESIRDSSRDVSVRVAWSSWSGIASLLQEASPGCQPHEQSLIADVVKFLSSRKVYMSFAGFDPHEYSAVVAGAQAGADRVYPAMAGMAEELRTRFTQLGWKWKNRGERSFGWWGNEDWRRASQWGRTYSALLWWPAGWPIVKPDVGFFGVVCNFLEPFVDLVFVERASLGARSPSETEVLAGALRALSPGTLVGFQSGSEFARTVEEVSADGASAAWLSNNLGRYRLRIRRRLAVEEATSTAVIGDALEALASDLSSSIVALVASRHNDGADMIDPL